MVFDTLEFCSLFCDANGQLFVLEFYPIGLSLLISVALLCLRQTLGFPQRLSDNPLQLAVGAAELVCSPSLYRVHRLSVHAQDKTLGRLLCHNNNLLNP